MYCEQLLGADGLSGLFPLNMGKHQPLVRGVHFSVKGRQWVEGRIPLQIRKDPYLSPTVQKRVTDSLLQPTIQTHPTDSSLPHTVDHLHLSLSPSDTFSLYPDPPISGVVHDEMVGWHHRFNEREFEQTLGDGEGQGSLACCSPRGCKESAMT